MGISSICNFLSFFSPQKKIDQELFLANQLLKIQKVVSCIPKDSLFLMEIAVKTGPKLWAAALVPFVAINPIAGMLGAVGMLTYELIKVFRNTPCFYPFLHTSFIDNLDAFEHELFHNYLERNRPYALIALSILEDRLEEQLLDQREHRQLRFRLDGLKDLITKHQKN